MPADAPGLDTSVIATAATARATTRRKRTRIALGVSVAVTVLWALYATAFGQWERIANNWFAALTMVFGSFVAGSTPQGGGAVAFPVFTKLLEVPSDVARSFSLCIQTIGMGTATVSILINRRAIEWRAVAIGGASAMLTFVVALFVLADPNKPFWPSRLPGEYVKVTFTILLASMAFVVYLGTKVRIRKVDAALPSLNRRLYIALIVAGIAGGVASSLTGSGADVMIYMFIVVLLGVDPRVGVPTSVIVMTLVSVLGFLVLGIGDGQLSIDLADGSSGAVIGIGGEAVTGIGDPGAVVAAYGTGGSELSAVRFDLFGLWIAALPVVAWGAPLGAFVASKMKARQLVYFAIALATAETISTAIFLTELHEFGWLLVYAVVGMLAMGTTLYFLAKYRSQVFALPGFATDEGLGRGHLDVVPGYAEQLSDDERSES